MTATDECTRTADAAVVTVGSGPGCVGEAAGARETRVSCIASAPARNRCTQTGANAVSICVVERGHAASANAHAGPLLRHLSASSDPMCRHTRSMIFSPNRPWGRNSKNTSATT